MVQTNHNMLGRSRIEVPRLCLGTMNFGRFIDEAGSHQILDAAQNNGLTYVDTSNSYGTQDRPHASEEIIGSWFEKTPSNRETTVLATKVFESTGPGPNNEGLSALNIRRACDASLRRLGTDYIDIYQMHHVDRHARWEEIWEAFDILRQQGKILYVGSSNFAGWHLAQAQEFAARSGKLGLISEQSVYSLAQRSIELEVLPAAREYGVGVVAWSPLSGGLLAEASPGSGRRSNPDFETRIETHRGQLAATRELAKGIGTTIQNLALAWVLAQPGVSGPIIGPRTVDQLLQTLPVLDLQLSQEILDELDRIWPGPGPAPEAYAW